MAKLSISKASKEWGIARSTLQRSIKNGVISATGATCSATGKPKNIKYVDTYDLLRVFGEPNVVIDTESRDSKLQVDSDVKNSSRELIEELKKDKERLFDDVKYYREELREKEEKIKALESEISAFSHSGFFKRLTYRPS